MRKIYIAHPLRGANREKNVEEVTKICKKVVELFPDVIPVSPIHMFSYLDNESKVLRFCLETVKECEALWLFGDWEKSTGCGYEHNVAKSKNLVVHDLSPANCERKRNDERKYHTEEFNALIDWLAEEVYAEPEPKPCPFCGGAADTENVTRGYGHVVCRRVSCLVKPGITWGECNPCHTRAEAIAAWNRRAGE